VEFDDFVSEQLHGPASPAIRGLGAAEGDKTRLGLPIEFARLRIGVGLAGEHGVAAVHDRALTDPLDCAHMSVNGAGDFAVWQRPLRAVFIGQQQNGGGAMPISSNTAFAAEGFEVLTFFGSESDAVSFVHPPYK
jgi:hypothetical protein